MIREVNMSRHCCVTCKCQCPITLSFYYGTTCHYSLIRHITIHVIDLPIILLEHFWRLTYCYAIHICCQNIRIANLSRCYHVDGATNTLFGTLPKAVIPPTLPSVLHTISNRDMHRAITLCLLVLIATCFTSSSTSSVVSPLTTRIKMQL